MSKKPKRGAKQKPEPQASQKARIRHFRLSFIWAETNTSLLGNPVPADAPMKFLGARDTYVERFERLRQGDRAGGLDFPWRTDPLGQHFWKYYLNSDDLTAGGAGRAWRHLMPFHATLPFTLSARLPDTTLAAHGFYYPHGFAVVVNADCKSDLTPEQAVEAALSIKGEKVMTLRRAGGDVADLSLVNVAYQALAALRSAAAAPAQKAGGISDEPFSVFTVVNGSDVDARVAVADGDETHRLLEAFSSLEKGWEFATLPKLAEAAIGQRQKAPAGHVLYGSKRGRAVWFPAHFTRLNVKQPTVTCYHKNLVFASMQVESLCGLTAEAAGEIRAGNGPVLRKWYSECAKEASDVLGRMYGRDEEMYRSRSPRVQMEQNRYVDDVNAVRLFFNKKELF